jgi:hypothetical protein
MPPVAPNTPASAAAGQWPEVVVRNASEHPIRDVRVTWPVIGLTSDIPVVAPGDDGEVHLSVVYPPPESPFQVEFTDNANRRWVRSSSGHLALLRDT